MHSWPCTAGHAKGWPWKALPLTLLVGAKMVQEASLGTERPAACTHGRGVGAKRVKEVSKHCQQLACACVVDLVSQSLDTSHTSTPVCGVAVQIASQLSICQALDDLIGRIVGCHAQTVGASTTQGTSNRSRKIPRNHPPTLTAASSVLSWLFSGADSASATVLNLACCSWRAWAATARPTTSSTAKDTARAIAKEVMRGLEWVRKMRERWWGSCSG